MIDVSSDSPRATTPRPEGRAVSAHRRPRPTTGLLPQAAWFGLLAGLVEATVRVLREGYFAGTPVVTAHTREMFWITPLVNLAFLMAAGLGLALSDLVRRVPFRLAVFVYTFLGLFSLRFSTMMIHQYAWWLLVAGCAATASRVAADHRRGFDRAVRWGLVGMATLVVLAAGEPLMRRPLRGLFAGAWPPPPPAGTPNVLLIVLDTVRAQDLSLYGYPRRTTPRLEELAATGVRFDRAVSTCSWTLPSHASMFTGRSPHALSADWQAPLDSTYPTLAQALAPAATRPTVSPRTFTIAGSTSGWTAASGITTTAIPRSITRSIGTRICSSASRSSSSTSRSSGRPFMSEGPRPR